MSGESKRGTNNRACVAGVPGGARCAAGGRREKKVKAPVRGGHHPHKTPAASSLSVMFTENPAVRSQPL